VAFHSFWQSDVYREPV